MLCVCAVRVGVRVCSRVWLRVLACAVRAIGRVDCVGACCFACARARVCRVGERVRTCCAGAWVCVCCVGARVLCARACAARELCVACALCARAVCMCCVRAAYACPCTAGTHATSEPARSLIAAVRVCVQGEWGAIRWWPMLCARPVMALPLAVYGPSGLMRTTTNLLGVPLFRVGGVYWCRLMVGGQT